MKQGQQGFDKIPKKEYYDQIKMCKRGNHRQLFNFIQQYEQQIEKEKQGLKICQYYNILIYTFQFLMSKKTQNIIRQNINNYDYKVKVKLAQISERYHKLALHFKKQYQNFIDLVKKKKKVNEKKQKEICQFLETEDNFTLQIESNKLESLFMNIINQDDKKKKILQSKVKEIIKEQDDKKLKFYLQQMIINLIKTIMSFASFQFKCAKFRVVQKLLVKMNLMVDQYIESGDVVILNQIARAKILTGKLYFKNQLYQKAIQYYDQAFKCLQKEILQHYMINNQRLIIQSVNPQFKKCVKIMLICLLNMSLVYEQQTPVDLYKLTHISKLSEWIILNFTQNLDYEYKNLIQQRNDFVLQNYQKLAQSHSEVTLILIEKFYIHHASTQVEKQNQIDQQQYMIDYFNQNIFQKFKYSKLNNQQIIIVKSQENEQTPIEQKKELKDCKSSNFQSSASQNMTVETAKSQTNVQKNKIFTFGSPQNQSQQTFKLQRSLTTRNQLKKSLTKQASTNKFFENTEQNSVDQNEFDEELSHPLKDQSLFLNIDKQYQNIRHLEHGQFSNRTASRNTLKNSQIQKTNRNLSVQKYDSKGGAQFLDSQDKKIDNLQLLDDYFKEEFLSKQKNTEVKGYRQIIQRSLRNKQISKVDKIVTEGQTQQLQFNNEFKKDQCVDYLKEYDSEAFLRLDQKIEQYNIFEIQQQKNELGRLKEQKKKSLIKKFKVHSNFLKLQGSQKNIFKSFFKEQQIRQSQRNQNQQQNNNQPNQQNKKSSNFNNGIIATVEKNNEYITNLEEEKYKEYLHKNIQNEVNRIQISNGREQMSESIKIYQKYERRKQQQKDIKKL